MKTPSFLILSSVGLAGLAAVAFYLGSPLPDKGASQSVANPSSASQLSDINARPEGEQTKAAVIDIGPLEAYSSNPPRQIHEQRVIQTATARELSPGVKVQQLLAMLPTLPADGKVLAMEHATKLIRDEDYLKFRGRLLSLAESPELRQAVLLDVLTRDDAIRMPSLVELMRHRPASEQAEVKEILEAYIEKDLGNDTKQWELAVTAYLAENAEG
jgi:hypothetical protein